MQNQIISLSFDKLTVYRWDESLREETERMKWKSEMARAPDRLYPIHCALTRDRTQSKLGEGEYTVTNSQQLADLFEGMRSRWAQKRRHKSTSVTGCRLSPGSSVGSETGCLHTLAQIHGFNEKKKKNGCLIRAVHRRLGLNSRKQQPRCKLIAEAGCLSTCFHK